jgi:hypothetical protein
MVSGIHSPQRPLRLALLKLVAGLSLLGAGSLNSQAQQDSEFDASKVVHLLQEPRHRTVYRDGGVFLLDVQVNPRDSTYPHTHNQAILLTYIRDENGPRLGEVIARTDYVSKPLTHVVDNPGPGMLHIMAMVNDNQGLRSDSDDAPSGLGQEPDISNPWFRSWRIELPPGEQTTLQTHRNPTAIILANPGLLHVSRNDGHIHELAHPGAWAWREADSPFMLRNIGEQTAIVVINESRRRRN